MEDYEEYFKHAKLLTELHAVPKELKSLDNVQTVNMQLKRTQSTSEPMEVEEPKDLQLEKKTSMKKENDKKKWLKRL